MIDLVRRGTRRLLPPLLALGLLLAGMLALGWVVTTLLPGTALGRWDVSVPRALVAHRQAEEVAPSTVLSLLASTPVVTALTAVAFVGCRLVFGRWRESLFVAATVIAEVSVFTLTTLVVHRRRPDVPHLDPSPPTSSFPSGHTGASVALWGAVAAVVVWHTRRVWLRWLAVAVGTLVPLLVGAARVLRGMHYPTDVLAGLLLGAGALAVLAHSVLAAGTSGTAQARPSRTRASQAAASRKAASEVPGLGGATGPPSARG